MRLKTIIITNNQLLFKEMNFQKWELSNYKVNTIK